MEATATLVIDRGFIAETIEASCGQYLKPDVEGWYLPYQTAPAIKLGEHGCQMFHNDTCIPFTTPEAIVADVVNKHGQVVVPFRMAKYLTQTPRYSPRALNLITACVEYLVDSHARWKIDRQAPVDAEVREIKIANAKDLHLARIRDIYTAVSLSPQDRQREQEIADRQLRAAIAEANQLQPKAPEVMTTYNLTKAIRPFVYSEYAEDMQVLERIEDHLLGVRTDVIEFLGENQWVMHFLKPKASVLEVEKTVDFRILEWHRMTGTPW